MPPCPLSRKVLKKLERSSYEEQLFFSDILETQSTDSTGYLADTLLVCDGGSLPTHGFLLQAASPVFQGAILSQGENYPYIREILLPDFPVKEMESVLTFIYKGYVNLESEEELKHLQDSLDFFQINNASRGGLDKRKIVGTLKIDGFNRIPQDIFQDEAEILDSSDGHIIIPPSPVVTRRVGKKRKAAEKSSKKANEDDDDSDYKPDSDVEKFEGSTPKRTANTGSRRGKVVHPVIKLKRLEPPEPPKSPVPVSITPVTPSTQSTPIPSPMASTPSTSATDCLKEEVDVETDEEDKGWEEPPYDDKDWMMAESSKCQVCSTDYAKHGQALTCVTTKHKVLRCYFCFKIYSNTEILFRHFAKRHKSAPGREKTVMCHFCDQMIPWKSVSCHVISVHLKNCSDNPQDDKKSIPLLSPPMLGRPPTVIPVINLASPAVNSPVKNNDAEKQTNGSNSKNETEPKEEKKVKLLKVGDLDVCVERQTRFGGTLKFHIKRTRADNGAVAAYKPRKS